MNESERSQAIEDVKTFVTMVSVAETEIQREILSKKAVHIRKLLQELFPTTND